MQLRFLDVLFTVLSLVVLIIPGYLLVKTKLFGEKADAVLSALVLYGCQPMLVFMSFQNTSFNRGIGVNMLIVAGLALAVHLIMIGIVYLVIRGKNADEKLKAKQNSLRFASVFSNCGYMGLPFLKSLFGENNAEIIIYGGIVIAVFNILTWSLGVFMMTGDKKQMSIKNALLNPTVIAIFVGLAVFFIAQQPIVTLAPQGSELDDFLTKLMGAFNYLGEMVTPLAMIVIGVKLANQKLKNILLDAWAYYGAFLKLIVMSAISILVVAFLPIDTIIKYAVFFCLSMPSATGTVMFAVKFGGDSDSSSVFVLLSTILSILTIPLMFLAFNGILSLL